MTWHLVHSREAVLDGVFGGDDFLVGLVKLLQSGVKRGRFAAARGACYKEYAVWSSYDVLEAVVIVGFKAQRLNTDVDGVGAKNTQDDAFAVVAGQGRNTEVNVLVADGAFDTPVLWNAFFGDVHTGENFETGHKRRLHIFGYGVFFEADAVEAVSDSHPVGHWFDVNIACPHIDGGIDDEVDEPNNGAVIVACDLAGLEDFGLNFVAGFGKLGGGGVDAVS